MAQLSASSTHTVSKPKVQKEKKVFKRAPEGQELRDIQEITALCERSGVTVDEKVLRGGIVYDPYPKYMTDVKLDYEEDCLKEITKANKILQMKKMTDLEQDLQ